MTQNQTKYIQAWQVNPQNAVKRPDSILQSEPMQKPKLVDPYQNRHRHQMLLINEQTKRIQIQNETIKALAEQKVAFDFMQKCKFYSTFTHSG